MPVVVDEACFRGREFRWLIWLAAIGELWVGQNQGTQWFLTAGLGGSITPSRKGLRVGNPRTIGMIENCPRCGSGSIVHVTNTFGVKDSYLCLSCHSEAPKHYSQGKLMPWDVILDWELDFWAGNAVKYICRAGKKPGEDAIDDYDKAIHYLRECIRQCKMTKNSSDE